MEQLQPVADEIRAVHPGDDVAHWRPYRRFSGRSSWPCAAYGLRPPRDRLVWDVGHQAYATNSNGPSELLPTINNMVVSAVLRRDNRSMPLLARATLSSSLSAALGMAIARDKKGDDYHVVA